MNKTETNDYVKSHGVLLPNGQVLLTKSLYVFKKVDTYDKYTDDAHISFYTNRGYNKEKVITEINILVNDSYTEQAIANLIIPVGSFVNLATTKDLKLRACTSICHSIVRLEDYKQVLIGESQYDASSKYYSARYKGIPLRDLKIVADCTQGSFPTNIDDHYFYPDSFCRNNTECAEGVHFFVELQRALDY